MPLLSPKNIQRIWIPLFVAVLGGVIVFYVTKTDPSSSAHPTENVSGTLTQVYTCCNTAIPIPPKEVSPDDDVQTPKPKPTPRPRPRRQVIPLAMERTQSIPVIVSEAKFEAKIFVNGEWQLNAPNTIELPHGTHTIKVQKDNESFETKIKIPTDRSLILIEDHYFKTD